MNVRQHFAIWQNCIPGEISGICDNKFKFHINNTSVFE